MVRPGWGWGLGWGGWYGGWGWPQEVSMPMRYAQDNLNRYGPALEGWWCFLVALGGDFSQGVNPAGSAVFYDQSDCNNA
ncbi:hypothetical protein FQR65_LT19307 [Abscondita terminalis]|nr:hypothetical protein FQR65_LT19307 [Abscondita terminalis]